MDINLLHVSNNHIMVVIFFLVGLMIIPNFDKVNFGFNFHEVTLLCFWL